MDLLERLSAIRSRGEAVAMATVVACRPPTSGRPGDRALVLANGDLIGWIGGGCTQPAVQREALRALADGRPRLLRLSGEPGAGPPREGVVDDVTACESGGSLEIYVEPFLPAPRLVVTGASPVAEALAQLGALADFEVIRDLPDDQPASAGPREQYVVVADMSGRDEADLERAVHLKARYVALVGSGKRLAAIKDRLRGRGVPPDELDRIKGPAGLDIHAVSPFEIAISVMAEIVARRRGSPTAGAESAAPAQPAETVDPVCGMRVSVAGARHTLEHLGTTIVFCCPACKRAFAEDPARYPASTSTG